jgi:hypothetical protein
MGGKERAGFNSGDCDKSKNPGLDLIGDGCKYLQTSRLLPVAVLLRSGCEYPANKKK